MINEQFNKMGFEIWCKIQSCLKSTLNVAFINALIYSFANQCISGVFNFVSYIYIIDYMYVLIFMSDIIKPMILNCTLYGKAVTEPNSKWGKIFWTEPGKVIDNADTDIKWTRIGNITPGDSIEAGTYQVSYTAQDKAGNKARPCKVELSMKGVSEYSTWIFISLVYCFAYFRKTIKFLSVVNFDNLLNELEFASIIRYNKAGSLFPFCQ